MSAATTTEQTLARYYHLHARLYDATRWSFLFGRSDLQARIAALRSPQRILEIGCGTGRNLARLAHCFPAAQLIGLDLSADMLARARTHLRQHRSRVILRQQIYSQPLAPAPGFDLIVGDVSFISLTLILPQLVPLLAPTGQLLMLVKPQFELQPGQVGKGGIVKDAELFAVVEQRLRDCCADLGLTVSHWFDSPIAGGDGNREFFIAAKNITRKS